MRKKDWNRVLLEDADNYTTKIDAADSSTTYIGRSVFGSATSESKWQLKKISISGNVTTIGFASGDDDYQYIWDNRASYTYS